MDLYLDFSLTWNLMLSIELHFWKPWNGTRIYEKFVRMLRQFHCKIERKVDIGVILSGPISIENGIRQSDILASALFAINFSIVFQKTFAECPGEVYIIYRIRGKTFQSQNSLYQNKSCDIFIHEIPLALLVLMIKFHIETSRLAVLFECITGFCGNNKIYLH